MDLAVTKRCAISRGYEPTPRRISRRHIKDHCQASTGFDFAIDDITFVPAAATGVPEPTTLDLLGTSLAGMGLFRRRA
jgi:hypothetical protein